MLSSKFIKKTVEDLINKYSTNDPESLIELLDIRLYFRNDFEQLLGLYTVVNDKDCIFINNNLDEYVTKIITAHELGHFLLHRDFAIDNILQDFGMFDISGRIEYEANAFAAQLLISDEDILKLLPYEYSLDHISALLYFPKEIVAIKINEMKNMGYKNLCVDLPSSNFLYNYIKQNS